MFPDRNLPSISDTRVRNAIDAVCSDYEQQLGSYFKSYFQAQARACYVDAVNKLEAYCEQLRQEMNQSITITLQEDVPAGQTACRLRSWNTATTASSTSTAPRSSTRRSRSWRRTPGRPTRSRAASSASGARAGP